MFTKNELQAMAAKAIKARAEFEAKQKQQALDLQMEKLKKEIRDRAKAGEYCLHVTCRLTVERVRALLKDINFEIEGTDLDVWWSDEKCHPNCGW
jgi:hypothetical protein